MNRIYFEYFTPMQIYYPNILPQYIYTPSLSQNQYRQSINKNKQTINMLKIQQKSQQLVKIQQQNVIYSIKTQNQQFNQNFQKNTQEIQQSCKNNKKKFLKFQQKQQEKQTNIKQFKNSEEALDLNSNQIYKWNKLQDQKLRQYVELFGRHWNYISTLMPGKTSKQIRERYLNNLDPTNFKKPWEEKDDLELLELIKVHGYCWKKITKKMNNRTQDQIKSRYYGFILKHKKQNKTNSSTPTTFDYAAMAQNQNQQVQKTTDYSLIYQNQI